MPCGRSKPERALIAVAAPVIVALVMAALSAPAAVAQSYPERPIRLIIPFAAGGPNDLIGRPLAEKMSEALGQPIVIENKGGAAGSIGTAFVAKSPPDGYTLLMTTGSFTGNVAISANPTYNPITEFAPITLLAQSYGIVLMTRPDFPAKTLTEFVALARKNPGKYSYGHAGIGNVTYIAAELFSKLAGIELLEDSVSGHGLVRARHHVRPRQCRLHVDVACPSESARRPVARARHQRRPTRADLAGCAHLSGARLQGDGRDRLFRSVVSGRRRRANALR